MLRENDDTAVTLCRSSHSICKPPLSRQLVAKLEFSSPYLVECRRIRGQKGRHFARIKGEKGKENETRTFELVIHELVVD